MNAMVKGKGTKTVVDKPQDNTYNWATFFSLKTEVNSD